MEVQLSHNRILCIKAPPILSQAMLCCASPPLQVQLSHNRITAEGAAALLRAVPAGDVRSKPLKMRLEWNRVSPIKLVKVGVAAGC